jgi:uncharacterized Fe-S center protein
MAAQVYFSDMRAGMRENLHTKLERLVEQAGLAELISNGDLVAIKMHFGEKGGHAYIRPTFIRRVVDQIKANNGKPFLTDSSTLYPGERKEAVSALTCAIENGFAYAVVNAPLIMSDGLRGHSSQRVKVPGDLLNEVDIGLEIIEADALIVLSHFKCHELTGFGGAIKNLAMGCSSREGKLEQHSTVGPTISAEECISCGDCLKACAHDAIDLSSGKAILDAERCVGCGRCITSCESKAIKVQWSKNSATVMKKMAEYSLGALSGKANKQLFVNFITQVSPSCDCHGHTDTPIVADIGILASTDPVALDQACADLVNQAHGLPDTAMKTGHDPGGDKFRGVYPQIDWEVQLEHGEKVGLGQRAYELVKLEPKAEKW